MGKLERINILKVLCGSRAYGLESEDSDWDYHSLFVWPTRKILSIGENATKTNHQEGETEDQVDWEVGHFLNLAVRCNPTILETFVAPIESQQRPYSTWIRELLPHVLSRSAVYNSFSGYSHNQQKKMFDKKGGRLSVERENKFAVAYLRSLHHGIELLKTGSYNPYIQDSTFRDFLREVKVGNVSKGVVVDTAEALLLEMGDAWVHTKLPEKPDIETVNDVLLKIRREFW